MPYVLISRVEQGTPAVLREYRTRGGALTGMRAANKNAGWTRITRCWTDYTHLEWCARANGLPNYDYGPYVIMHRDVYDQKYRLDELVPVQNKISGETVMIPRRDRGGPCDPSTERYWSM